MRILAVIPARAGSKGIPNKNIRLINNKPLIYYSIDNARNSKYITDVVVTTDSPEIEVIAKQMGVKSKTRCPELCADDVTLDAGIPLERSDILYDPQTAGGLLISVPEARAEELLHRLHDLGVPGAAIGQVLPRGSHAVHVRPGR